MAAGATISGQLRVAKVNQLGDTLVVAGPLASVELDQDTFNQKVFINAEPGVDLPFGGANARQAPEAVWQPGEQILVQHKSAALAEAVDHDADEFLISIMERDLNTGIAQGRTLTVADQELTADPTSSTSAWVTVFKFTVPDRLRVMLRGHQKVAAVEAA